MVSSSVTDLRVLSFNPGHFGDPPQYSKAILLPMHVYPVLVSKTGASRLNLIERTVLGLVHAGKRDEEIASLMHLSPDLVEVVLHNLRYRSAAGTPNPLIEGNPSRLTDDGTSILLRDLGITTDTIDRENTRRLYVFRNPLISDRQIEFVGDTITELGVTPFGENQARLDLTSGRKWQGWAFKIDPWEARIFDDAPPALNTIRKSIKDPRVIHNINYFEDNPESRIDEKGDPPGSLADYQVIVRVDDPELVLVRTVAFRTVAEGNASRNWEDGWSIADPFGQAMDSRERRLRAMVRELGVGLPELQRFLADVSGVHPDLHHELLTTASFNHVSFRGVPARVTCEVALMNEAIGDVGRGDRTRIVDAFLRARRSVEQLVAHLMEDFPPGKCPTGPVWHACYDQDLPIRDRSYIRQVYEDAARAVGFATPLAPALASVRPETVRAVCTSGGHQFRAVIVANLLAAERWADHPWRLVAKHHADFLSILDNVAAKTGAAIHDLAANQDPRLMHEVGGTVEQLMQMVYSHPSTLHSSF